MPRAERRSPAPTLPDGRTSLEVGGEPGRWCPIAPRAFLDDNGLHAFIDAWFVFIFALAALGFTLYASTKPERAGMLVLAVVVGELAYRIGGDVWLIGRGHDAASYSAFSVPHLAFTLTGILRLRGELKERAAPGSSEVSTTMA
jgi:hypothetical protein